MCIGMRDAAAGAVDGEGEALAASFVGGMEYLWRCWIVGTRVVSTPVWESGGRGNVAFFPHHSGIGIGLEPVRAHRGTHLDDVVPAVNTPGVATGRARQPESQSVQAWVAEECDNTPLGVARA